MLEIKDLKKIYKTKNGAPVRALDGVSLRFPQTGMVFLLGKSGSGKSTLLNVCGGLDNPTEGEVIVKGRSSKDFSQSDFDSYRNTFIGFIFQEYNILNEFSVEDNIALALELQGKAKDKAAVAALLEEVDLAGYAKRKPNTLSGGQKQRIAIARALVKKPEIIMADEPTGALDSHTGKQVLQTLKKLSKSKLVIVVSHDREFAEQYGDRIIELKDGQVLSDVSKTQAASREISENVRVLGDVICVKKGADLSEQDFAHIKSFLKQTDADVMIASGEKTVSAFKTAARITDQGQMEVFRQTDSQQAPQKQYTKEESRFIRSKLPLRHAFKIGVSGLKTKPFRLFFTILLCSVAFVMFGLLSTLNFYNSEATFRQTAADAEVSAVQLTKEYSAVVTYYAYGEEENSFDSWYEGRFAEQERVALAAELNENAFGAVYFGSNFNLRQVQGEYWNNYINGAAFLPEDNALRSQMVGQYPVKEDQLALSSYLAEMLVACNVYDAAGTVLELNAPDELIGKSIAVGGRKYTITGIVSSGEIPAEFDALKESAGETNYSLRNRFFNMIESGLHLLVFVSEDRLAEIAQSNRPYVENSDYRKQISIGVNRNGEYQIPDYGNAWYTDVEKLSSQKKLYAVSKEGADLAAGELLMPSNQFASLAGELLAELGSKANEKGQYEKGEKYYQLANVAWELSAGGVYEVAEGDTDSILIPFTDKQYDEKMAEILKVIKSEKLDMSLGVQLFSDMNQNHIGQQMVYQIVGVYKETNLSESTPCYLSATEAERLWQEQRVTLQDYAETQTDYVEPEGAVYTKIYLPGNVPADKVDAYWQVYSNTEFGENASRLWMTGGFTTSLKQVDSFVRELSQVFLYVGLGLAVFAALLLSNFISVSISNKKREIGILRAVGARSLDVFKIFFSESFVIGMICVVLSGGASAFLCKLINREYAADLGASVFVFGPASVIVLVGIALVTVVVATFLPVYNAAKKKPVDSIRAI